MYFKHVETAEDYRYQLPFEADKSKSIAEMTLDELRRLNQRLSLERETQGIILDLRRNSGERYDYDHPPQIDTQTPVEQLYHDAELTHHGVLGMKWGVRKERSTGSSRPKSSDFKTSRTLKQKPLSEMSNAEIKQVVERLRLEKEYSRLTKAEKSFGKRYVENFAYAGAPLAITSATSFGLEKLTPLLEAKGFDANQVTQIANALPKIGAAVSLAVKIANDTRNQNSSSQGRVDKDD